jgi:hypothetical protein
MGVIPWGPASPRIQGVPTRYEIVVAGEVGPVLLQAMPGFRPLPAGGGEARLVGELADQAALGGLVERLLDLQVELLGVQRLDG